MVVAVPRTIVATTEITNVEAATPEVAVVEQLVKVKLLEENVSSVVRKVTTRQPAPRTRILNPSLRSSK